MVINFKYLFHTNIDLCEKMCRFSPQSRVIFGDIHIEEREKTFILHYHATRVRVRGNNTQFMTGA